MPPDPRLRILQVCSASQATYGAVQSLLTLARGQREYGHQVEFVTFRGKRFGSQVRAEGFGVHEVRVRTKIDLWAIFAMRRIIKTCRFDLVHTHLSTSSVNGTLAAKVARVPSVSTVHGLSGKLSFVFADSLIAVSEGVKQHLVAQGLPEKRITVVHNGLDFRPSPLSPQEARASLGLAQAWPVLGTVSRVTALKGTEDGIRTVARLKARFPDLVYLLVGDGDAVGVCLDLARELGVADSVRFEGYQKDVARYLAAMDLFLFPSLKEAMGIALVEAMAAGLPIVATNVDGIPEVLAGGAGHLCPPHDPGALAAACERVLSDPAEIERLQRTARSRAEDRFSATAMVQGTERVYRRALGRAISAPVEERTPVPIPKS